MLNTDKYTLCFQHSSTKLMDFYKILYAYAPYKSKLNNKNYNSINMSRS